MGRGRGKRKKLTVVAHEDTGSGEEEKASLKKRRGRPQKPLIEEQEFQKIEENGSDNEGAEMEIGKRRKRNSLEENGGADNTKPSSAGCSGGFRHIGSRRKSTPHRAAEAGVRIDIFFSIES